MSAIASARAGARVVVVGEAVWDLFADLPGARLRTHRRHVRHVGGVEANLASTLARLGVPTTLVTTLGDDPLGDGLFDALAADGVDVQARRLRLRTPVVFVDVAPDGARRFVPYRAATADGQLAAEDLDALALDGAAWLHLSGSAAASATARAPAEALIARAQRCGVRVSLDVNARPWQWAEPAVAREHLDRWADQVDLAKASDEDLRALWGEDAATVEARLVARRGGRATVITRGAEGATGYLEGARFDARGKARRAIDATGAGDAFMAGLLAKLHGASALAPALLRDALVLADRLARDVVDHLGARPSGAAVRVARRAL
jgi:sugar/nucleoside kinase (ribokinase family)